MSDSVSAKCVIYLKADKTDYTQTTLLWQNVFYNTDGMGFYMWMFKHNHIVLTVTPESPWV